MSMLLHYKKFKSMCTINPVFCWWPMFNHILAIRTNNRWCQNRARKADMLILLHLTMVLISKHYHVKLKTSSMNSTCSLKCLCMTVILLCQIGELTCTQVYKMQVFPYFFFYLWLSVFTLFKIFQGGVLLLFILFIFNSKTEDISLTHTHTHTH